MQLSLICGDTDMGFEGFTFGDSYVADANDTYKSVTLSFVISNDKCVLKTSKTGWFGSNEERTSTETYTTNYSDSTFKVTLSVDGGVPADFISIDSSNNWFIKSMPDNQYVFGFLGIDPEGVPFYDITTIIDDTVSNCDFSNLIEFHKTTFNSSDS